MKNFRRPAQLYIVTGVLAVVMGGVVSAFLAKQPSTFAMWVSAYLVLVAGVAQVFFGGTLAVLVRKASERLLYSAWVLFNVGNVFVIASTAAKYAAYDGHVSGTVTGGVVLVGALLLLGWQIRNARRSWLKVGMYSVLVVLAVSIPIGLALAQ